MIKFSSILEKIKVKPCLKKCKKCVPFCFELTGSIFLINIWITLNPIFSQRVSLGAKVSIGSSYQSSKCDCAMSIFVNFIFALTA